MNARRTKQTDQDNGSSDMNMMTKIDSKVDSSKSARDRSEFYAPGSEQEAYQAAHQAIEFGEKLSPLVDSVRAVVGAIEYGDLLGNAPFDPGKYQTAMDLLRLLKSQADTCNDADLLYGWDDAAEAVDLLAGVVTSGEPVNRGEA